MTPDAMRSFSRLLLRIDFLHRGQDLLTPAQFQMQRQQKVCLIRYRNYPQIVLTGSQKTSWHMLHLRCLLMSSSCMNSLLFLQIQLLWKRLMQIDRYLKAVSNESYLHIKIIVMLSPKPSNSKIFFAYFLLSSIAAITFAIAMLCTLPVFEASLVAPLYILMLKASAISFIMAELAEYLTDPVPRFGMVMCFLSVLGNALYFWSSSAYQKFNKGELYLVGQFFISLSFELKILIIITHEKRSLTWLLRQEKNRFLRFASIAIGAIFFLAGSVMAQLEQDVSGGLWSVGIMNLLAGTAYIGATVALFRRESHKGYEKFDQSVSISRVV